MSIAFCGLCKAYRLANHWSETMEYTIYRIIGQYGNNPQRKLIGTVSESSESQAIESARNQFNLGWCANLVAIPKESEKIL